MRRYEQANCPAVIGTGNTAPVIHAIGAALYSGIVIGNNFACPLDDITLRPLSDHLGRNLAAIVSGAAGERIAPALRLGRARHGVMGMCREIISSDDKDERQKKDYPPHVFYCYSSSFRMNPI